MTKTHEDTGEMISETRKGVAAAGGLPAQLDVTTSYAKSTNATTGEVTQTVTQTAGTATRTLSVTVTDVLGRTKSVTDEIGRVTSYNYSADGRQTTETLPGGLTRITTTYLDGQLKSITGTAVVPEFHDYKVNNGSNNEYEAGSITETVWTGWNGTGSVPWDVLWRKTTTNFLGWVLREEESLPTDMGGSMARTHTYNAKGQRVATQDAAGITTSFEYDDWGNLKSQMHGTQVSSSSTTYLVEGGKVLEKTVQTVGDGNDATTTTTKRTLTEGSTWQQTILPDGRSITLSDATTRTSSTRQEFVHDTSGDAPVLLGTRTLHNGRLVKQQTGGTDGPVTILGYDGLGQMTSRNDPATGLSSWDYDPATGQLLTETSAGSSAITYTYHPVTSAAAGRLASRTASGAVTRYDYHRLGGLSHQWGNGGQPLRYEYDAVGRLTALHTYQNEWGWDSTEKPAAFSSPLGDDSEMTQWEYYPGSRLLYRKIINSTPVAEYGYDGAGRVTSVTQASSNPSSRTYDSSGRLETIEPNSSGTPSVTYTYQPDGSLATISDAAGLHRFTTDPSTGVTTETIEELPGGGGLLAGIAIVRKQTSDGRPLTVEAHFYSQNGNSITYDATLARHQYEWTPENRLHRVYAGARDSGTDGPGHAYEYDWDETTGRLGGILSQPVSGSAPTGLHAADRHYGYTSAGGRVETLHYNTRPLSSSGPGQSVLGYHYTHDAHGRRQQVQPYLPNAAPPATERPPGWEWAYNDRGEVENAARFTAEGGPVNGVVPSQTRAYSFDRMGNRLSFTQGSGADAITKQTPFQSINKSQQPTLVLHDRKVELTGSVAAGGVNILSGGSVGGISQGLGQTGEPGGFRTLVQLASPDGAMLGTTVSSGGTERQGYLYVPPAEEVLGYDQRGNLIKDARWEYTWDVNNRLVDLYEIPMATMAGGNASLEGHFPRRMIRLAYDYMGRRIAKTVWVWLPGVNGWRLEKDLRYVYDGWQMIAELDHTFAPPTAGWQPGMTWGGNWSGGPDSLSLPEHRQAAQMGFGGFTGISGVAAERSVVRTYLWGQDLSGTMTGAGGVCGLLSVTHQGITYHTCSDANGNITGLLAANGADAGQLIARFDYDPFGSRITNTGPDVEICPMGFSTKYTDSETGLVDYGLRIYSPPMARFASTDPIEEQGGVNLYGFVGNDPVNRVDYLGMNDVSDYAYDLETHFILTTIRNHGAPIYPIATRMLDHYLGKQGGVVKLRSDELKKVVADKKYRKAFNIEIQRQIVSKYKGKSGDTQVNIYGDEQTVRYSPIDGDLFYAFHNLRIRPRLKGKLCISQSGWTFDGEVGANIWDHYSFSGEDAESRSRRPLASGPDWIPDRYQYMTEDRFLRLEKRGWVKPFDIHNVFWARGTAWGWDMNMPSANPTSSHRLNLDDL